MLRFILQQCSAYKHRHWTMRRTRSKTSTERHWPVWVKQRSYKIEDDVAATYVANIKETARTRSVDSTAIHRGIRPPTRAQRRHPGNIRCIRKLWALPEGGADQVAKNDFVIADNQRSYIVGRPLASVGVATSSVAFDSNRHLFPRRAITGARQHRPHIEGIRVVRKAGWRIAEIHSRERAEGVVPADSGQTDRIVDHKT